MLNSGHTTNEIDVAQCPVSWGNMATVANTVRGRFWLDCTEGLLIAFILKSSDSPDSLGKN